MIGETALHTRAPCDECGDIPATRESDGGIIVCERCNATPPANDDVLGALLRPTPLCSRCSKPAFLRVDDTIVLCADCWLKVEDHLENDSSFAAAPSSGENVTAAGLSPLPTEPAVVTPLSRECASRSPIITTGDCPGTELPAPRQNTLGRLDFNLSGLSGPGACGSERDGFGATNSITAAAPGTTISDPLRLIVSENSRHSDVDVLSGKSAAEKVETGGKDCNAEGLAAEAVIYPARRGASHRASFSESGACEGNGSNADGSKTADGSARYSSCGSFGSLPSTLNDGVVQLRAASLDMPGPQDSVSPGVPCDALPCRDGETSVTLACTPGESTPRKGGSPVTVGVDATTSAPAVTPNPVDPGPCGLDFEAEVSALEARGFADCRNVTQLRVVAASDKAENSKPSSVAGA